MHMVTNFVFASLDLLFSASDLHKYKLHHTTHALYNGVLPKLCSPERHVLLCDGRQIYKMQDLRAPKTYGKGASLPDVHDVLGDQVTSVRSSLSYLLLYLKTGVPMVSLVLYTNRRELLPLIEDSEVESTSSKMSYSTMIEYDELLVDKYDYSGRRRQPHEAQFLVLRQTVAIPTNVLWSLTLQK
jgi:hypothetical protein